MVVPEGIDDPTRPSGGNTYDRRVRSGLSAVGWEVQVHEVPGQWPRSDASSDAALARVLTGLPDGAVVLVDGLVASPSADVLVPAAARLRLVALVHMPLGQHAANGARERERAVLRAAAAVVTTSRWAAHVVSSLYALPPDRVHVAEPGADVGELAPGTATGGTLLSVAAVTPVKGHDVLVDALALLPELPWSCLCVGSLARDVRFAGSIRRRIRKRGLDGRVRFSGPQTGTNLSCSYGSADVLVLPSRSETYGMVVTEALARGLPVIATAVGGVPEALGYGAGGTRPGLLVPPDDMALRAVVTDRTVRARLAEGARAARSRLRSWDDAAALMARTIEGTDG